MAVSISSNAAIDSLMRRADKGDPDAQKRLDQIAEAGVQFDQEDYRTVSTERGPVRGYPGGAARRL
jgi:hypothetical protein